jgi:hypothetical protein
MKNWKTTTFGAITAIGVGLAQSEDENLKLIGQILSVVGPILFGFFAKDYNVTGTK